MDILILCKLLSLLFSCTLIMYSLKTILDKKARTFFILMILSFFSSTILFFPEGRINDWIKHVPFFIGQLFLYYFLSSLLTKYTHAETAPSTPRPTVPASGAPFSVGALAATDDWFNFLTDQGLQHFLAVPLFFVIVTNIRLHYPQIRSALFRSILNLSLLAGASLTMIHLGEFIVESQHLLSFLEGDPIEIIEFLWYYAACVLFFIMLKKMSSFQSSITSPTNSVTSL